MVSAHPAAAQADNTVNLDATYLGAPTDWCPSNAGVPLVVTMDGPDIVEGPKGWPKRVKVTKGGQVSNTISGENTTGFIQPEDYQGPFAKVVGRFSAEFRVCHSAWSALRLTGSWRLSSRDGGQALSGNFKDMSSIGLTPPFFLPAGGTVKAEFAKFGDATFFTAGRIKTNITENFAAKPDKE